MHNLWGKRKKKERASARSTLNWHSWDSCRPARNLDASLKRTKHISSRPCWYVLLGPCYHSSGLAVFLFNFLPLPPPRKTSLKRIIRPPTICINLWEIYQMIMMNVEVVSMLTTGNFYREPSLNLNFGIRTNQLSSFDCGTIKDVSRNTNNKTFFFSGIR